MSETVSPALAPQRPRFKREFAESPDYILEPAWDGTRALAVLGDRPEFVGYGGKAVVAPLALLQAIAASCDCERAVVDGVIVHRFSEEADLQADSRGDAFTRAPQAREIYVAVDLLEVDGASLRDAPLLERKRHLAGLLRPGPNVRLSPFVRRGMRAWRDTLAAQGFKRFLVKKVNSRYHAGETSKDWLEIEKI